MHEIWKRSGLSPAYLDNVEKQGHKHYHITMANIKTKTAAVEEDEDKRNSKSILSDISNVQNSLNKQYYRVEVLEKALAYKDMTNDEREVMEAELEAIKNLLASNENILKRLQQENRQTPSVAGVFVIVCIGIYFLYTLVSNSL